VAAEVDYYAILGIDRTAAQDDIRAAYRRAARASHPDLNPGDLTAAERFKLVRLAYDVLADPVRRAAYDAPPPPPRGTSPLATQRAWRRPDPNEPVSLARELGETVRAIRVVARRSGFTRRVNRLIRYLERL
jgi:curved DNA-binding protein CbpA